MCETESNPCQYADSAIEQLLIQNRNLQEENQFLREQIKRLIDESYRLSL